RCGRFRRDSGSDRYRRRQGPSNSQTPQAFQFLLQVFHGVVFIHIMGFEEPVELVPGSKTQQPPQLRFGDMTALEFLESQRFQGAPRKIATRCAHAPGEIVGNLNGEFHAPLPYRAEKTHSTQTALRYATFPLLVIIAAPAAWPSRWMSPRLPRPTTPARSTSRKHRSGSAGPAASMRPGGASAPRAQHRD